MKSIKHIALTNFTLTLLSIFLTNSSYTATAQPEEAESLVQRTRPLSPAALSFFQASRPKAGRRPHLTEYEAAALKHTLSFTEHWESQFKVAADFSQQRAVLGTVLETAQKELQGILNGAIPEDASPSSLSAEEIIRQGVQKRRLPSEDGEENSVDLLIKSHQAALQTTQDEDLSALKEKVLHELYERIYHASLTRVKVESWARAQLFYPAPLSFCTAEEILFPQAQEDSFKDKVKRVSSALKEAMIATQSLKAQLHEDDSLRMSSTALDRHLSSLTGSWETAVEKGEDVQLLILQMQGTLQDALTEHTVLFTHWKRVQDHLASQKDSEDEEEK
jgi:hypothetical protein